MEYNFKKIGQRIRELRRERGWTQDNLVEKLYISRNTLSAMENGKKEKFTLDILLSCCSLFDCDMGYLLGEYEECKTINIEFMHQYTGLSESSIQMLHFWRTLESLEDAAVIDKLLLDSQYHNEDRKSNRNYRPVLNLLHYFFKYQGSGVQKQIYANGAITDQQRSGYISANAIALNDVVIENAVLAEIQQALSSLKRNLMEQEK